MVGRDGLITCPPKPKKEVPLEKILPQGKRKSITSICNNEK